MTTISSKADLRTYVQNSGDFTEDETVYLVARLQEANHPSWGADWGEWLSQQDLLAIAQHGACSVVDCE